MSLYYIGFSEGIFMGSQKIFLKIFSVPIDRVDIFGQGLFIMARLTQGLPVLTVPEQLLISSMRNDMINHRSLGVSALLHALSTQRVTL